MSSLAYTLQVNCFVCDIAENTTKLQFTQNYWSSFLESLSKEVIDLQKIYA